MRLRLNTSHRNTFIKSSKSLKRKRKDFENEIKDIIVNTLNDNNNNKELVERNVSLLAEIEILKKEKLDLFERFMFKLNPNQMVIQNDLMVILESLKSDRKEVNQLFQTTNDFFNKMIDKISDKIEEVVRYEDKRVEYNTGLNESNVGSAETKTSSQEIYEMRQMSKTDPQNDCLQNNNLSLIPEVSHEFSAEVSNPTHVSVERQMETPIRNTQNSFADYEMTPHFSTQHMRTPSIYNFNSNSFNALRPDFNQNETTFSTFDESVRPELMLSGYETLDTTVTEEQNGITSSTPVCQTRLSSVEMIQRPSKRISSINRPFSPRFGRSSLIDIQNVMENSKKNGKNCVLPNNSETVRTDTQSNDTNSMNVTTKRRKKCDTKSFDSDNSESSANTSLSLRSSRRNRKQVSYKEPSLMGKLRRKD